VAGRARGRESREIPLGSGLRRELTRGLGFKVPLTAALGFRGRQLPWKPLATSLTRERQKPGGFLAKSPNNAIEYLATRNLSAEGIVSGVEIASQDLQTAWSGATELSNIFPKSYRSQQDQPCTRFISRTTENIVFESVSPSSPDPPCRTPLA